MLATRRRSSNRTPPNKQRDGVGGRGSDLNATPPPPNAQSPETALHGARSQSIPLAKAHRMIPYTDVIVVWLRSPLDSRKIAQLRRLCLGKLGVWNRRARFDPELRQCLILRQPTREAIDFLKSRNDTHLNYVELSLDTIFANRDDLNAAALFTIEHSLVKERRGQRSKVCFGNKGPTYYSAARRKPDISVTYANKASKITGDPDTLHDERRLSGTRPLQRHDLATLNAIPHHDAKAFWQQGRKLYRIKDYEGLGRAYLNFLAKQQDPEAKARRKPLIKKAGSRTTINMDKRMGHQLMRVLGLFTDDQMTTSKTAKERDVRQCPGFWMIYGTRTIQNLYDHLNRNIPLDRFLEEIDLTDLIEALWDETLIPMKQPI